MSSRADEIQKARERVAETAMAEWWARHSEGAETYARAKKATEDACEALDALLKPRDPIKEVRKVLRHVYMVWPGTDERVVFVRDVDNVLDDLERERGEVA